MGGVGWHVSQMGLEHPLIVEIRCVCDECVEGVFLAALETLFFNNLEISPFVSMCRVQLRLFSLFYFLVMEDRIGNSVVDS